MKSKNRLQYLCACLFYLTFKTSLVKKYWELKAPLNFWKKNFRKKIFRGVGDSPIMEKGRKIWFLEIDRKCSRGHFKPLVGHFGWKMKVQRNIKVRKCENQNSVRSESSLKIVSRYQRKNKFKMKKLMRMIICGWKLPQTTVRYNFNKCKIWVVAYFHI